MRIRLIRMLLNGFKMIYCWIKVEVAHYLNAHAVNKNVTKRFGNDVLLNHIGMCGDSVLMEFVGTLTVEITSSVSTVFNYLHTQFTKLPPPRTFENCPKTQPPPPHTQQKKLIWNCGLKTSITILNQGIHVCEISKECNFQFQHSWNIMALFGQFQILLK